MDMYSEAQAEIERLRDENEALRARIHEAVEVYAGMEGVPLPETACEAYLLRILREMMAALAAAGRGDERQRKSYTID